jgi:peptidoglycan/LPS O-acetylase OafA/YrhL
MPNTISSKDQSLHVLAGPRASAARNGALDGLRGIAIAMVLWLHLVHQHLPPGRGSWLGWLRAGTGLSWAGVDLFFALSGFFIGGILIDHRDSPRLVGVFYLRRAVRILPLYYVTLVAIAVAIFLNLPGSFHLFPPWVYALFLTNFAFGFAQSWDWLPLSVLWSLAVEEQFYLTAPWIARAIPRASIPFVAVGLFVAAEVCRGAALLVYPHGHFALQVLTPFRMDALALGVLVAWTVREKPQGSFWGHFWRHWRLCLASCFVLLCGLDLLQPSFGSPVLSLVGYPLIAVTFAIIILIVVSLRPRVLCSVLESRPLVHLGRHSYFIYMWHGLLGGVLIRWIGGPDFVLNSLAGLGLVAFAIGATWAASIASWKWLEGPILAWGQRQAY